MKDKTTLILTGVASVVAVVIVGILVFNVFFSKPKSIEVTNFVGKNISELNAWAEENKIETELVYEFSEEFSVNTILSQSVKEGDKLSKKDKLVITISRGLDPEVLVKLIDFTGKTQAEIEQFVLENKLMDVTYEYVSDAKIKKDVFIKVNTTEKEVKRNTMLIFTISTGKEETVVKEIELQDFSTYTKAQISSWGKANSVTIKFATATSDKVDKDKVISQSPKAGTTIKTGSTVTVTISLGKAITAIDFTGKTKTDVDKWISDNSNRIKVSYTYGYSDTIDKNKVLTNSPKSGTLADGATITVKLSLGKVSVDDYKGKSESSFRSHIQSLNQKEAKLTIKKTEEYSKDVAKDVIIKQDVVGTTTIGKEINIVVSKGKEPITVQSFVGKTLTELETWAKNNGLTISKSGESYHDTYGKDSIVSQTPNNGTIQPGSTNITYVLSLGAYTPSASLYASEAIYSTLKSEIDTANNKGAGWSVSKSDELSATIESGKIISCSVNGKAITCKVSSGLSTSVQNFVGGSKPCSDNGCSASDLKIYYEYEANYSSTPKDQVTKQSINSGSIVAKGTSITLTLSKGPEPKGVIPSYGPLQGDTTQATIDNLNRMLSGAGFTNYSVESVCHDSITSPGFIVDSTLPGTYSLSYRIVFKVTTGSACPIS